MQENTLRQGAVNIGLPVEIVKKIDKIRGDVPRSTFLRKKIIALFDNKKTKNEV